MARCILVLGCWVAIVAGCAGGSIPSSSACRGLEYDKSGPSRAQFLPCAGEMVAVLEELDPQVQAAASGDPQARSKGRDNVRKLRGLMNAAGGRNLLERWSDRALMDFNVDVNNAITHYEAFYMVRILDGTSQLATQSQDAARAEANAASRRADEAMNLYRRLK